MDDINEVTFVPNVAVVDSRLRGNDRDGGFPGGSGMTDLRGNDRDGGFPGGSGMTEMVRCCDTVDSQEGFGTQRVKKAMDRTYFSLKEGDRFSRYTSQSSTLNSDTRSNSLVL